MATRIGVDVGGTFTDLIFFDDLSGESVVAKVPSVPAAPDDGVLEAISILGPEAIARAKFFLHGTTVGINALLERTGDTVALLCTRGFRDVLEIRRADRDDPYNIFWTPIDPLVPRRLRFSVAERMAADGSVVQPLDTNEVHQIGASLAREGTRSVAVAYLHAYANPEHELTTERALRDSGYRGHISLSHRVSREYREYERTSTTVIDAYVRRRVSSHLRRLHDRLRGAGFSGELLVTRSGGGAMTFDQAALRPVEAIMSGPVAGAQGAAELARELELDNVVAADVGGTSFDASLILNGRPVVMFEGRVAGMPVQVPWVDVRSIGAGGGSIAFVDSGGLLHVGPASAGSEPGPACYARGGEEPTVTDAAHLLGMLGEGALASGLVLRRELAEIALARVAAPLGLDVRDAARGVLTVATASMANAIREITVEQGHDPRRSALVAFGGAGPLFGTLLASHLSIGEIIVPVHAGNFSAWGLLGADVVSSASRTSVMRLDDDAPAELERILGELFAEITSRLDGEVRSDGRREAALDIRYVGQNHTLTVDITGPDGNHALSLSAVRARFRNAYQRTYGIDIEDDVEVVAVRGMMRRALPRRLEHHRPANGAARATVDAYSFTKSCDMEFAVLERGSIGNEDVVHGPAVIVEPTATTYLDCEFAATNTLSCLRITRTGRATSPAR